MTPPQFAYDDSVVVTAGLAAGLEGKVVQRTEFPFGNVPQYAVRFPFPLCIRVIRADYLRKAAA